jgi:asparagine synthase (glutamine-hydrolysing)
MGVKPLYYFLDGEKLIFASEIRAILETGLVKKKAAPVALVNYLSCQSVPFPYSAVENIRQVQAGSWMKVGNGKTEEVVYWDPAAGLQHADYGDEPKIRQRIKELMMQSVQRRLVSDVPVGAFLSGGIDSSVVVGLMAESGSTRPNTFTVSFDEQEFDESHYAELIAEKFNTCHERILLKPDAFLETLPDALDAMDIPSGDGINTYMVSKAVHEKGMRVALSGTGGDELFAGYPFFHQYLQLHSRRWLWKLPAAIRRRAGAWITGNERIRQLLRVRSISIDQVYPVFRQILSPGKIGQLASLNGEHNFTTAWEKILADRKERLEALPLLSQVSVAEYLGYTQHTLLKDMDQMGMAVSLEIREPFFDQDLVEFVMAIPDSIKRPKYPKSLLVESVRPLLPDSIVFRKKQGFVFPWQSWLKHELRSFCEQYLRHMEERTFVHGKKLRQYWQSFLGGDSRIRWMEIWLFVVLEYWMEKNGIE